jgi:hypothetical protein
MRKPLLILFALLVVAGGVAYAAIPGADGTISGCYRTIDGTLRVIDAEAGQTCRSGEKPITWSQTGPPGPPGEPGEPGETLRWTTRFDRMGIKPGLSAMDIVCPSGYVAIGGGWNFNIPGAHIVVWKNIQSPSVSRVWELGFRNEDAQPWPVTGYALCAQPPAPVG